jgi:translation initiation factor 2 alpha subunit (eIF-2alpha)
MELEEGDIVLCTVDRIVGTVVFVKIDGNGEGNIITSEIAPGRIRNLRDYVVPKKKIVCKILKISGDQINLSLRRVTQKEKKEVMEKFSHEKSFRNILKTILKEKADRAIEEITKKDNLYDFLNASKENPKDLEKITGKEDSKKILEIIKRQKQKRISAKKDFFLTSDASDGVQLIKKILKVNAEIKYLSAGKYSVNVDSDDIKSANNEVDRILKQIESSAKHEGMEFKIK